MTPITGITEEDLQIATAIEKSLGRSFHWHKRGFIMLFPVEDLLRLLGKHAAEDPGFRVRYVQAAKNAGLIP